ncbi:MAG: DUF5615 family PIN-like protein [Anaerolineales bacterium]|nr:DUF5615 family PIN-like protein [Anaerolineales bacterium]
MNAPVNFYMDEHVHPAITRGLRLREIDVLTAQEANMLGASDKEHLKLATNLGRVVFTNDDDFLKLHAAGIEHAGIAFAHQRTSIGRVVRALTLIHEILSVEDMTNRVEFL